MEEIKKVRVCGELSQPARDIISSKAMQRGLTFSELLGDYVLLGLDAERRGFK